MIRSMPEFMAGQLFGLGAVLVTTPFSEDKRVQGMTIQAWD
jgi:hypothetical protein